MDEKRFEAARNKIIGKYRERAGIGTLQEKTVHAVTLRGTGTWMRKDLKPPEIKS